MLTAFRRMENLKILYFGYLEEGSAAIGVSSYPANLQ
jgi:hypothetical protein